MDALISAFKQPVGTQHPIEAIELIPSSGGCYEISMDGELIYSKKATGQHIAPDAVVELIRSRL